MTLLFLLVMAAAAVISALVHQGRVQKVLHKKTASKAGYLAKAVSMLVLTAQVSELVRVVEHTTVVNVAAALMLLAVVLANKAGTEGELHS